MTSAGWPSLGEPSAPLRVGVEAALAALLVVQAARLAWIALTPLPTAPPARAGAPPSGPAVDLTAVAAFDPFFRDGVPAGQGAAPGEALRLYGVRTGRDGGSAIIGTPDGRQLSLVPGQAVIPGVTLRSVRADHVILVQGSRDLRLGFPPPGQAAAAGQAPPAWTSAPVAKASQAADVAPKDFLAAAGLVQRLRDGRVAGYQVIPRGAGDTLARAGLEPGDVIVAVDGSELNPERYSELPDLMAGSASVELRFERNGQIMTTRLGALPGAAAPPR